ncbi:MAG: hypothetical protein ACM3QW_05710 [Ignavibacteriales bacterium]
MIKKLWMIIEDKLDGHISIGNLTVFGANAMRWGCHYWTKKWGYICFRLPLPYNGVWCPLYFYISPNATPWAATFMLGRKHNSRDWALSRIRRIKFGHNFRVNDEEIYTRLCEINDFI